jgi:SP family sugar:H+ symporter-like MFS transporter
MISTTNESDANAKQPTTMEIENTENSRAASLGWQTTPLMTVFALWIGFAGWVLNFDIGYTGIVLQMLPFNNAFGHCKMVPANGTIPAHRLCKLSATQQSLSSIYVLFMALGGGLSGIVSNYLGRKGALQVGSVVTCIGASGMLGTSGSYLNYLVCKCIGAVGIGHLSAVGPGYGTECVDPRRRGLLVSLYSVGLALGSVVVAAVCVGSSRLETDWAWKTPIICQIPVALIFAVGLIFFPESPRWLMVRGEEEKARRSFGRFYNREPFSEAISRQVREVQATIELEKTIPSTVSWIEIFNRKYIRRTVTAVLIIVGSALSGVWFVHTYGTIFLADVGISNPFVINLTLACCNLGGNIVGPAFCEYVGRRLTLLLGYAAMCVCMLIVAAVSTGLGSTNQSAKNVLVAFLCLWYFIFGSCNGSTVWVASVEQHSVRHRTYGQAFTSVWAFIFVFATSFWSPYMLNKNYGNMGTNIGYFYGGLCALFFIITFFVVPETARLSLEQIDEFYASGGKAWKTSLARNKKVAAGHYVSGTEADAKTY